jgi:hypothetical protein
MWHCSGCGEAVADQFDICWKCGTGRDGTASEGFEREADDPSVPDPGPSAEDSDRGANMGNRLTGSPASARHWYQHRLRTPLLIILACSLVCSWLAMRMHRASKQREAVAAIRALEGDAFYDYQFDSSGRGRLHAQPSTPLWLRNLLGDDFFADVWHVGIEASTITDADIECIRDLPHLRWLRLNLSSITDAGLENLKGLSRLERLFIEDTKVTEEGVEKLQQALPNCKIYWEPPTKDKRQSRAAPDQPGGWGRVVVRRFR